MAAENLMKLFTKDDARLFSYIVAYDGGSAPNPENNLCTLAICKPQIRSVAKVGDVIVGLDTSPSNNRVVYCMIVNEKVTWEKYVQKCKSDPKFMNRIPKGKMDTGDCIWDEIISAESMKAKPSWSEHDGNDYSVDVIQGKNVLISSQFWYFGKGDKYEIKLPEEIIKIIPGRGHRSNANHEFREKFADFWLKKMEEIGVLPFGKYGTAKFAPSENEVESSACSSCRQLAKENEHFGESE
jgi:hypothetical protein